MKHMRKLASLLLALVMVFALATTAFAATVTVPTEGILKDHSFTAYQIFKGNESSGILSNVEWGDGVNSETFLTALKSMDSSKFGSCTTAADVAKVLGENNTDTALANAVAKLAFANKAGNSTALTSGTNSLADGYYLIEDTTENVAAGSAYNTSLLQVVGNINITVKTDAPSVEKKVLEDDKYNQDGGYGDKYNDVADYNMGDAVPFKLIGTVPDMSRYDTYKYIFHDTLSAGLSLNENTIKVYVASDKAGSDKAEITGWTKTVNGQSFTVSFTDLKTVANVTNGKFIIVEYTATLNQGAVVGLDGNPNEVYLQYSNKPDQSGEGENHPTGETPHDKVIVFTYELDTTKVDGQNNATKLKDAEFVLMDSTKTKVAKITNGKFDGWVEDSTVTKNDDGTYPTEYTLKSAETTGLFSVVGLDDGTYYLKETKAPAGYNLLKEPVAVVITATTSNGQNWTSSVASDALTKLDVTAAGQSGTGDTSTGIASITIANNKGSTLPETGGIGTTIFYVVGSILVIGAAVLLVTKKRMSAEG